MLIRFITISLLSLLCLEGSARESRIYFTTDQLSQSNNIHWLTPLLTDLRTAAFELRGATDSQRAAVEIYWSYDSVPGCSVHKAAFMIEEGDDNLYGSNSPTVTVMVDGAEAGRVTKGIASRKGNNSLAVEMNFAQYRIDLLAGSSHLASAASLNIPADAGAVRFGISLPRNWSAEMAVVTYEADPAAELRTGLTDDDIASLIATSGRSPAGYWRYLDRDCNADYARLGGEYSLAIVQDDEPDCYLILYMGGAVTGASHWQPGMIKGKLKSTPFAGHYDLVWYDALMTPHSAECSATLEQPQVLRLDLPLLKASIRLAAIPQN